MYKEDAMSKENDQPTSDCAPVKRIVKCCRPKTKDGHECEHLYLLRLRGTRNYKCCDLSSGFLLSHWRCVGRQSPECPLNEE